MRYVSSVMSWKTRPISRRTSSRWATTSKPATDALPAVGRMSVHSMLIVVDFPAPLGPRNPKVSPACTSKSTPRTASRSPKRFSSPSTLIAGGRPTCCVIRGSRNSWYFQR